jgi:hypothetical protein
VLWLTVTAGFDAKLLRLCEPVVMRSWTDAVVDVLTTAAAQLAVDRMPVVQRLRLLPQLRTQHQKPLHQHQFPRPNLRLSSLLA